MKKHMAKNFKSPKTNIQKILVPMDWSKTSFRALDNAINLSKFTKSEIVLFHVLPTDVSSLSIVDLMKPISSIQSIDYEKKIKKTARKIIDGASLICKQNNIRCSSKIISGNPSFATIKFAHDKKNLIDLIVMGSKRKGHAEEILLGSVSYHVVDKSKIPVLIFY